MARKTERFAIDGDYYEMTQLGTVVGQPLFHEVRKLAMPLLRGIVSDADILVALQKPDLDVQSLDPALAGKIVALMFGLFESLPKALELELTQRFAEATKVRIGQAMLPLGDSREEDGLFDQHFAGRYMALQKWLIAAMKFHFAGFLGSSAKSADPVPAPTA
jgi:hypothetical protein